MNKDFNKKLAMMLAFQHCRKPDEKLKKMQDNLNEFILNKQAEDEKMKMMIEHPEWFINSSPKEFGMKRKNKRFNKKYLWNF